MDTTKHILFITTGGTIASVAGQNGLTPAPGPDVGALAVTGLGCKVTTKELFRLDSSNIQPEEWQMLAAEIHASYQNYEGIVITHGTDTLAYTASILSYMLQGISIPIVLTGSQLPLDAPLTDAIENLRTAFAMALTGMGGIFVAFDRKILLGTRAVKARTRSFNAFESINVPPLAVVDARGLVFNGTLTTTSSYQYRPALCSDVFLLKLTPGTSPALLEAMASLGCRGIVIEAFGAGGLQNIRRNFAQAVRTLTDKGICIVVVSQCLYEPSDFTLYEVGREALSAGAIEGRDMTSEAAVTKLMWALGNYSTPAQIREVFNHNLAGEVSV